jgi:lipopolysaccharide/colanic/teichoic acid biosynthesis glycosyltransferase
MLNHIQVIQKRIFDISLAIFGILLGWWIILIAWIIASFETRSNGLFIQKRIGKDGKPFFVWKIKTMYLDKNMVSTVTTSNDQRITKSGKVFRKTKIDELPQLFNVLFGTMSFVGPRPDVPGFADCLEGEERQVLMLLPGITGPASIKYKDEEFILAKQDNPEKYNREIIWPDKVKINQDYMRTWSLKRDVWYIFKTIVG